MSAPDRSDRPAPNRDPLTPLTLLERTLRVFPDKHAVAYGERRWTWAEFGVEVGRMAGALRRAGVGPGDRVAFLAPNVPELLAAHFAVLQLHAALVAINTRLQAEEVGYILDHSGAKVVVVDPELAPAIPGSLKERPQLVNLEDPVAGITGTPLDGPTWAEFADGADVLPVQSHLDDEDRITSINYTSGTTGRPKGVQYTHRGAYLNALGEIVVHGLGRDSVYLWTLPLFHCNGWCFPWAVTAAGGSHVMLRKVDPPEILRLIREHGVTHFNGAPTVLLLLAEHPDARGVRFDPPVRVATGGAPPSPTLLARMEQLGVRVTHLYGLTETYGPHVYCQLQPEWETLDVEAKARVMSRQGVPYHVATHLRVVDDQMRDVPADASTLGEVVMRGNNVMKGYYRDDEATAQAFAGGWFHSGDIGVVHPDGYIELRDRKKDIIISGGENISTIEVEHTLVKHPAVLECAVVSMPHEKWGEVPKAFVSLRPGETVTEADLIAFARERLAHFKCPKAIEFTELPKTSTGKIQKFKLREQEWAGRKERISGGMGLGGVPLGRRALACRDRSSRRDSRYPATLRSLFPPGRTGRCQLPGGEGELVAPPEKPVLSATVSHPEWVGVRRLIVVGQRGIATVRRARCSLVAAYAFGAFPLVSTIVQWSAAIRGSREIGRPLGYRDFDNTELSAGATVHVDLGASVLVLSVLLVPVGSVVVGVWLYLNRRDFWPIALWLCGVSVWWLSAFASPVFFGLAERVLD